MNKTLKRALLGGSALMGVLLVAAVVVVLRFDPNEHKAWLIQRVQIERQRSLAIPGRIELSFFPSLGLKVGEISLSELEGPGPFAAAQGLRASLAVLPLLGGRVVVDSVQIDGLRVQVQRHPDGSTSIDDLLAPPAAQNKAAADPAPGGPALRFDITGIALRDATLQFDDQRGGRKPN